MSLVARFTAFLFVAGALLALPSGPAGAQQTVTIQVGDNGANQWWFCDSSFFNGVCETTVNVGDTVAWNFNSADLPHTSTECGASCPPSDGYASLWNSGFVLAGGGTFEHTFDQPGEYLYYCAIHGTSMSGRIVVQAPVQQPSDTPTDGGPTDGENGDGGAADGEAGNEGPGDGDNEDGAATGGEAAATPTAQVTGLAEMGAGAETGSSGGWWVLAMLAGAGIALVGLGAVTYRRVRVER